MAQITVAQFRQNFPEFANQSRFPTGFVQFWMNWSYLMLNATRFGTALDMAAQLFTAHNITLERLSQDQALIAADAQAGAPGLASGPINSKSVDKTSVGYDITVASDPKAEFWNRTVYGQRLWQLIKWFGAGGVQLGVSWGAPWFSVGAWIPWGQW